MLKHPRVVSVRSSCNKIYASDFLKNIDISGRTVVVVIHSRCVWTLPNLAYKNFKKVICMKNSLKKKLKLLGAIKFRKLTFYML